MWTEAVFTLYLTITTIGLEDSGIVNYLLENKGPHHRFVSISVKEPLPYKEGDTFSSLLFSYMIDIHNNTDGFQKKHNRYKKMVRNALVFRFLQKINFLKDFLTIPSKNV